MAGNSIGREFTITTFGESHGRVVGVLIDGCPAGLALSEIDLSKELELRIPDNPKIVSARMEKDQPQILSGVFNGFTTGAPITITVENKETKSSDYKAIKNLPRPAHSDYPARIRYGGFNDYRGGGRFSGRITVALIMAGVVAKKLLAHYDIEVLAYTQTIGPVRSNKKFTVTEIKENRYATATRCPDGVCAEKMEAAIIAAREAGDSVGGVVECVALNMPAGIGEPLFDTLDGDLAKILFSIPAVKGVEFGAGFRAAELRGSENNDAFCLKDNKVVTTTQNAGGILGGLSNGMPIVIRVAIKPTPSIAKEQQTVDLATMENTQISIKGRHDFCVVPKAVPAVEAAVAVTLVDHLMRLGKVPKILKEP
ncbi:chorismate synthase [Candidatus Bathycorpusculum sp.]|uniref:chorismate synthase n=1 Tax=Candidatus Bathycorpusculum sp. TaxID=2994959 RepID=UPI00282FFE82|nr:chorismate synthase [Candidatus Termitimicrobium sp.]MCL2432277.1 chorismate synthase [Candidatus Termitimicrobium sp.]